MLKIILLSLVSLVVLGFLALSFVKISPFSHQVEKEVVIK